jgi:hypothetical protein
MDQMRPIAEKHNLTLLQLACVWNLVASAGQIGRADADPGKRERGQDD